jgi:hypothetical protein
MQLKTSLYKMRFITKVKLLTKGGGNEKTKKGITDY